MKFLSRRVYRSVKATIVRSVGILWIISNVLASPVAAQKAVDNPEVIGVISGSVTGTYARFAHQMSVVLDSSQIRVLPMLGKGSQQNLRDLLYLNGIDIAIVQSDVLDYYRSTNELPGIEDSIRYITKLYNEEIHVVVSESVRSIKELEGEIVSVGSAGSGTEMTAINMFSALGVNFLPANMSNAEALDAVKQGLIKAAVFVVGKPATVIQEINETDGLALLRLDMPKSAQAAFFSSELTHQDYPALIPEGQSVSTISVGAVLAVFNWSEDSARHDALTVFSERLVEALDLLKTPGIYHPKWQEVEISTEVPGWKRFSAMQRLISN